MVRYIRASANNKTDEILPLVELTLEELGISAETAHLTDLYIKFSDSLEAKLRSRLGGGYISLKTQEPKYKLNYVGGSPRHISGAFARSLWLEYWKPAHLGEREILDRVDLGNEIYVASTGTGYSTITNTPTDVFNGFRVATQDIIKYKDLDNPPKKIPAKSNLGEISEDQFGNVWVPSSYEIWV